VPDGTTPESRVKRFARWVSNDTLTTDVYFLPYADVLLRHVAVQTLVLVLDGSVVGRGGVALMRSVGSKGRALPVAWLVRHGHKGHFPEALHLALVTQVKALIPHDAPVGVRGDGAFDGTGLRETLHTAGWASVGRTALSRTASWEGTAFRLDTIGWCLKAGPLVACPEAFFTRDPYGPLLRLCCWATGEKEPLYVVSNMSSAEAACRLYATRFRIETFVSDQKSRGVHLHKSHIADADRLSRL
jgi:hypothetical protein